MMIISFVGEEGAADDLLCCLAHSKESLLIFHGATREPHFDAVGRDALDGRIVEGHQQLHTDVLSPEHFRKVQTLLGLLCDS